MTVMEINNTAAVLLLQLTGGYMHFLYCSLLFVHEYNLKGKNLGCRFNTTTANRLVKSIALTLS